MARARTPHPSGHRRVWHCVEHANPFFTSKAQLREHLEASHKDITETQIQSLLAISVSSVADLRSGFPMCLVRGPFRQGVDKHIAFRLETFAAFSVSRSFSTTDGEAASGHSSQAGPDSREAWNWRAS